MKIQDHIKFSIEAFERFEKEHALLHACFAIDATARNLYSLKKTARSSYIKCLREYYWLLAPFIGGLDLNTKFEHVSLFNEKNEPIINPDIAEIIYYVFRCNSAHACEIPINYGLVEVKDNKTFWGFGDDGILYIPERIVWGLLAIGVFSSANTSIVTDGPHYLTYTSENFKRYTSFLIKDYWGKEEELKKFLQENPPKLILLDDLKQFKKLN